MGMIDFSLNDIGDVFTKAREAITGKKILDPAEMAEINLKLKQLEQASRDGQISINKIEAAHKNLFIAGWRPFIGWVCGVAIAYAFIGQPVIEWIVSVNNVTHIVMVNGVETEQLIKAPDIDSGVLFQLVLAMLGMAGLRTFEKTKKVSREK